MGFWCQSADIAPFASSSTPRQRQCGKLLYFGWIYPTGVLTNIHVLVVVRPKSHTRSNQCMGHARKHTRTQIGHLFSVQRSSPTCVRFVNRSAASANFFPQLGRQVSFVKSFLFAPPRCGCRSVAEAAYGICTSTANIFMRVHSA